MPCGCTRMDNVGLRTFTSPARRAALRPAAARWAWGLSRADSDTPDRPTPRTIHSILTSEHQTHLMTSQMHAPAGGVNWSTCEIVV